MTSIRSYRRSVLDWLRAEYGVRDAWVDPTGRHSRVRFTYLGRERAFPLNDRNAAGGSNAADLKLQDIRRELGPPPPPSSAAAPKRTLQEMTMTLEAKAPFNPLPFAPALDSRAKDAPTLTSVSGPGEFVSTADLSAPAPISYPCTIALRPVNKCLEVTLPAGLRAKFGHGGCAVGFTAPDLLTIRHATAPSKYAHKDGKTPEFNARGYIAFGATGILRRLGFGFNATPHRASLANDTIQIKLNLDEIERKPFDKQKPEVRPAPPAKVDPARAGVTATAEVSRFDPKRVPGGPQALPTEAEYLAVLAVVRDLETRGAYRLARLRNADGSERLTWRAPEIG